MPPMVVALVLLVFLLLALGVFVASEFFIAAAAVFVLAVVTGAYLFRTRPR